MFFKGQRCLCRHDVSGFPTFKFSPKSDKSAEEYEGDKELEDSVNFINKSVGPIMMETDNLYQKLEEL